MKYEKVDWSSWPEAPAEDLYNDWAAARKSKGHPVLTQTALNTYAKHLHRLADEGVCNVEKAMEYAAEAGWRALRYAFVIGAIGKEMNDYSGVSTYSAAKETRSIGLEQELNDTSWAKQ